MSAHVAPSLVDQIVGSYRILSQLGAGGMGTVWLAEHTLIGRRVAIKFLHADISRNASTVERFFSEARAATRISDPGIVVIYDFGWHTDGSAYIVMELLVGESLAARLASVGRLPLAHAVHAVEQAAMAMAVAHARGIIHRDLKPDNIFLIPDPIAPGGERIKLLDFGIAKLVGADAPLTRTSTGLIMGTPMYMSPEQCRGAGDIDHRTDIYALGCVFFHLLCGREPFMAIAPGDLIAAHLREPAPPPSTFNPHIPPEIDRIVLRCLAKSAGDRYASMTELVRDLRSATGAAATVPTPTIVPLRAISAPGAISTLGTSAGESFRPAPRRRRRALALALAATILVGTMIGVGIARRTASAPPAAATAPVDAPLPPPPPLPLPLSPSPSPESAPAPVPTADPPRVPSATSKPARPTPRRPRVPDPLERR